MRPLTFGIAAVTAILSVGATSLAQPYRNAFEPAGMPMAGYQIPPVWGGGWQGWGTVPGPGSGPQNSTDSSQGTAGAASQWNEQPLPLLPLSQSPLEFLKHSLEYLDQ